MDMYPYRPDIIRCALALAREWNAMFWSGVCYARRRPNGACKISRQARRPRAGSKGRRREVGRIDRMFWAERTEMPAV